MTDEPTPRPEEAPQSSTDEDAPMADSAADPSTGSGNTRTRGPAGPWRLALLGATAAAMVLAAQYVDGGVQLSTQVGADASAQTGEGAGVDGGVDLGGSALAAASQVTSATIACPGAYLGAGDEQERQHVSVVASIGPAGRLGDVESEGEGSAVLHLSDDSRHEIEQAPLEVVVDEAASAWVLAEGRDAAGIAGGQLAVSTDPGDRGLGVAACTTPDEVQWLVGGGGAPGRTEHLVLTNPGADAITVAVSIWGADGPADVTGGTGIVVPAHTQVVRLLDGFATAVESPVIKVEATGGPVVAHLGELYREGTTDLGTEIVTAAASPATDLVVPAAPRTADGPITLRLVAPGDQQAVVDLTALTEEGAHRLPSHVTRVPAGHSVDVVLDDLPGGDENLALRIRSDVPVTAGAQSQFEPTSDEPVQVDPPDPSDAPDARTTTDDAAVTSAGPVQDEPLVHPAGDLAWVAATEVATGPLGIGLGGLRSDEVDGREDNSDDKSDDESDSQREESGSGEVPGATAALAVTAVDAADVAIVWVLTDGTVRTEQLDRIPNDTTRTVAVPHDARAVWVVPQGPAGVAASLQVSGSDELGPLVASTTLPAVPWTRSITQVRVVRP